MVCEESTFLCFVNVAESRLLTEIFVANGKRNERN